MGPVLPACPAAATVPAPPPAWASDGKTPSMVTRPGDPVQGGVEGRLLPPQPAQPAWPTPSLACPGKPKGVGGGGTPDVCIN